MERRSLHEQAERYADGLAEFLAGGDPAKKARILRSRKFQERKRAYEDGLRAFARGD